MKLKTLNRAAALFAGLLAVNLCHADTALPYETWLKSLVSSFTGPVAFSCAILGIIACGATLIFAGNEIKTFTRSVIYIVMVMALIVGANSMLTDFFGASEIAAVQQGSESEIPENPALTPVLRQVLSEDGSLSYPRVTAEESLNVPA